MRTSSSRRCGEATSPWIASCRAGSSAPRSISTPRTSTASTTSTPTCPRPSRRSSARQPAALGGNAVPGSRQSGRLRHPHQQRARQRRRRQLRAAERRRGQLVELRPVAVEDHRVRPVGPRRLQLRQVEVDLGPRIHRRDQLRPQQPRRPIRTIPARASRSGRLATACSRWSTTRAATSASGRRRFRRSSRRATSTNGSSSRLSYMFAGDMNGDSISANDLIYIPRDSRR